MFETMGAGELSSVVDQVIARWFTPAYFRRCPQQAGAVADMLEGTDPEGYAGCAEAIAAMDLRPVLPAITAPTADPAFRFNKVTDLRIALSRAAKDIQLDSVVERSL